ncbi:MAG TPA: YncE family protein [Mycobacterium sp.]|jgi:DNA-binding beta-propeller fold protein YncE|nr:YncE family protein [Mycobacterium sp.]
MSHSPIDPEANRSTSARLPCPDCGNGQDCPQRRNIHTCPLESRKQRREAVVATISLGGQATAIAPSPDGHQVYVIAGDSVKVISRLHHVVGAYHIGPHPKSLLVSADGTRVYVTGFDGSTSVINTIDRSVKTFMLERSDVEALSPDGNHIYRVHSGIIGDTGGSWISVVAADGETVAVVPVPRHATDVTLSPDGRRIYVASRSTLFRLDWRGVISVIDTRTFRVIDKIAVELAADTLTMSLSGTRLYATHYHKNSFSIIDVRTRVVSRWAFGDAPIEITASADDTFACVTNLHSLTVFNAAANMAKRTLIGGLPRETRLSVDGTRAYVLDFACRTILAVDTTDNVVTGSVDVDGHPEAMTLSLDGELLYVTDYRAGVMTVISTALLKRAAHGG